MVKIRLTRMGDKKAPFYRIVVADERAPRDGRFIDIVGTYNPLTDPAEIKIDADKAKQWIKNGAQPTDTVKALLIRQEIIPAGKRPPAKTGGKKSEAKEG